MNDLEQCAADNDDLIDCSAIKSKGPEHIIWEARLELKIACEHFSRGSTEAGKASAKLALAYLELLKV